MIPRSIVVLLVWSLSNSALPSPEHKQSWLDFPRTECDEGLMALERGDAHNALSSWESISPYASPTERLSAVIICLRTLKVVDSDEGYRQWLDELASKGDGRAAVLLASDYLRAAIIAKMYAGGAESDDSRSNVERGKFWLDIASQRGEPDALWLWSIIYAEGIGVEADQTKAHQLIIQAAEAGSTPAMEKLEEIEGSE